MYFKSTSHLFHAIMTIIFFPWLLVWILCYLSNEQHNKKIMFQEQMRNMNKKH